MSAELEFAKALSQLPRSEEEKIAHAIGELSVDELEAVLRQSLTKEAAPLTPGVMGALGKGLRAVTGTSTGMRAAVGAGVGAAAGAAKNPGEGGSRIGNALVGAGVGAGVGVAAKPLAMAAGSMNNQVGKTMRTALHQDVAQSGNVAARQAATKMTANAKATNPNAPKPKASKSSGGSKPSGGGKKPASGKGQAASKPKVAPAAQPSGTEDTVIRPAAQPARPMAQPAPAQPMMGGTPADRAIASAQANLQRQQMAYRSAVAAPRPEAVQAARAAPMMNRPAPVRTGVPVQPGAPAAMQGTVPYSPLVPPPRIRPGVQGMQAGTSSVPVAATAGTAVAR